MKVLLVDDEPGYLRHLRRYFAGFHHEVHTALTARAAIDLGIQERPDLLVADCVLQDNIDGLDVVDALRVSRPTLHAVLITGFASPDLHARAKVRGVTRFIEKPLDFDQLARAHYRAQEFLVEAPEPLPIALVESDARCKILHANDQTWQLMSRCHAVRQSGPEGPAHESHETLRIVLQSVLHRALLRRSLDAWQLGACGLVAPYWIRTRRTHRGGWSTVLVESEELREHRVVQSLLNLKPNHSRWRSSPLSEPTEPKQLEERQFGMDSGEE